MYVAMGSRVYYVDPDDGGRQELFLTVHPTTASLDCLEQAMVLARVLNAMPVVHPA